MSQASSSWSWKVRGTGVAAAAADVIRSACPPGDDVAKLTPFQAVKNDDAGEGGTTRVVYAYLPPRLCSALLAPYSPHGRSNVDDISLRVILALHGYSGRPLQEIRKWHEAAVALDAVILAPQGTKTPSDGNNLGWNAVDCCGDPARHGIDDLDFVIHGAVEAFLEVLGRDGTGDPEKGRSGDNQRGRVPVIATGFSNGGFLSSLLGLLPPSRRPPWLAGVVPTGGYQYDAALYEGPVRPLPAMSHHGGRDSIVRPEGCCVGGSDDGDGAEGGESNCFQDIGAKRDACLPVLSAFEMWSDINGCTATISDADEDAPNEPRRAKRVDKDEEPIVTCWKGVDCIEPTDFCMWNNEGHGWGSQFPGIEMAQAWMEEVFRGSEARFEEDAIDADRGDDLVISYAPAISYVDVDDLVFDAASSAPPEMVTPTAMATSLPTGEANVVLGDLAFEVVPSASPEMAATTAVPLYLPMGEVNAALDDLKFEVASSAPPDMVAPTAAPSYLPTGEANVALENMVFEVASAPPDMVAPTAPSYLPTGEANVAFDSRGGARVAAAIGVVIAQLLPVAIFAYH